MTCFFTKVKVAACCVSVLRRVHLSIKIQQDSSREHQASGAR